MRLIHLLYLHDNFILYISTSIEDAGFRLIEQFLSLIMKFLIKKLSYK